MKQIEFSVVMPCLNEAKTLEICIKKIHNSFKKLRTGYEIVVADNGSTDGSQMIAKKNNARVVNILQKGYGAALQGGIEQSKGKYVIMGDADDSYDFSKISGFIEKLRAGDDLVMGNRFAGGIMPGAMPALHKLGNPFFSFLGKIFFNAKAGDFYSGLRGFKKEAWSKMDLQTTGMEYAIEMVTKASLMNLKVSEVPIILHKDGRGRRPHLRTWQDGWRTLRFMLLFAPRWLFFIPGVILAVLGLSFFALSFLQPARIGGISFDVHTLLVSSAAIIIGIQIILLGFFTEIFVSRFNLIPRPEKERTSVNILEYGLIAGLFLITCGLVILGTTIFQWSASGFGNLDYATTMRAVIPAVFLSQLGVQLLFNSFFFGIITLPKK